MKARATRRQKDRGDAVPRESPDMAASPWPGTGGEPGSLPGFPGSEGPPRNAAYALQSPAYFQPPGGTTIRLQGRRNAQVLADGELILATQTLQGGNLGALRIVNVGITNLLLTSNIVFRIKIAGAPVEGWTWSPFAQAIAVMLQEFPPESTLIEIPEGAKVDLTSTVLDAGAYDIDMMAQGWRYGRALRDDFDNAWRAGVR